MIRPALPEDMRFVRSSWLQSFADSDFARILTPKDVWERREASNEYYDCQRLIIEVCLDTAAIYVDADTNMIDGWLVCEPGLVHYVYVRQSARGRGVARRLLEAAGIHASGHVEYTHRSRGLNAAKVPKTWKHVFWKLLKAHQKKEGSV